MPAYKKFSLQPRLVRPLEISLEQGLSCQVTGGRCGYAMGTATCWECGREVPANAKVCPHDDCWVLNPVIDTSDDGELVECRNKDCSRQVKKHATVCSACGTTNPGVPDNWGWKLAAGLAVLILAGIVAFS